MKKVQKKKNRIGLVGHVVKDITSTKEDEALDVKTIIDYVNNKADSIFETLSTTQNWNELYEKVGKGIKIYKFGTSGTKPTGFPFEAYSYGTLIVINENSTGTWCSCQIYITDKVETNPTDNTRGVYIRVRQNNNWLKISGTNVSQAS